MTCPQSQHSELTQLAESSGISAPPGVFRIIQELLALQISPEDIYILLKQISAKSTTSPKTKMIHKQATHKSTSSTKK